MRRSIVPLGWALCAVILVSGCGGSDVPKSEEEQPNNEAGLKSEERAQSPPDQSLLELIGQSVRSDPNSPPFAPEFQKTWPFGWRHSPP